MKKYSKNQGKIKRTAMAITEINQWLCPRYNALRIYSLLFIVLAFVIMLHIICHSQRTPQAVF